MTLESETVLEPKRKSKKYFPFKPKKLKENNVYIWLDHKERPRLAAFLLYHKCFGIPSVTTEKFLNSLTQPMTYVPCLYNSAKPKKAWSLFSNYGMAKSYLMFSLICGYFKWTEKKMPNAYGLKRRNPRFISMTSYGKLVLEKVEAWLALQKLEELDAPNSYPLYIIKKKFYS